MKYVIWRAVVRNGLQSEFSNTYKLLADCQQQPLAILYTSQSKSYANIRLQLGLTFSSRAALPSQCCQAAPSCLFLNPGTWHLMNSPPVHCGKNTSGLVKVTLPEPYDPWLTWLSSPRTSRHQVLAQCANSTSHALSLGSQEFR